MSIKITKYIIVTFIVFTIIFSFVSAIIRIFPDKDNSNKNSPSEICNDLDFVEEIRESACADVDNSNLDNPLIYGLKAYKHQVSKDILIY